MGLLSNLSGKLFWNRKSDGPHWDSVFSGAEDSTLGWYEKDASQTFVLLNHIAGWENSVIMLPGAGTSVLIEELLIKGAHLLLNDISGEALDRVKTRLQGKYPDIQWLYQDISQPFQNQIADVDIWLDRAVLHFLTQEEEILGYFENVLA
ncbi:MAG: class I SAM-dependent methyltransferase, partial [Desulfocapsa sp.]|nr:class I SAM-dependent methyltransferase [Desulfocapsa sp.]